MTARTVSPTALQKGVCIEGGIQVKIQVKIQMFSSFLNLELLILSAVFNQMQQFCSLNVNMINHDVAQTFLSIPVFMGPHSYSSL